MILNPISYRSLTERVPDSQYQSLIREIWEGGVYVKDTPQGESAKMIWGYQMKFKMANGFPMITQSDMSEAISATRGSTFAQSIGEILCFVNGGRTQEELESFGCYWWKRWLTEQKCTKRGLKSGDNGPGSYGAAFHDFPMPDGGTFNQFDAVIVQMRERPELRTHFISSWIPFYTFRGEGIEQKVVVAPCHGMLHLRVVDGKLYSHMFQRSADVPCGVPSNMIQYPALCMALASLLGLDYVEHVHSLSDCHIYESQFEHIPELLAREPKRLPTVELLKSPVTNIYEVRSSDFNIKDYDPHPKMRIGTPV